jgi:hypothetical protein
MSVTQWSIQYQINESRLIRRLQAGWTIERSLTEPVGGKHFGIAPVPYKETDNFNIKEFKESLATVLTAFKEWQTVSGSSR